MKKDYKKLLKEFKKDIGAESRCYHAEDFAEWLDEEEKCEHIGSVWGITCTKCLSCGELQEDNFKEPKKIEIKCECKEMGMLSFKDCIIHSPKPEVRLLKMILDKLNNVLYNYKRN